MSTPSFVDGIGAFADRYQGFLLDQWGVIHDGQQALPAALAALGELKRRNKRLVVLSNSGRRAALNRRRLAEMGFNVAMFDAVVTSGEAAWQALERRNLPGFRRARPALPAVHHRRRPGRGRGSRAGAGRYTRAGRFPVPHRHGDPAADARRLPRHTGACGRARPAHGLLQPRSRGAIRHRAGHRPRHDRRDVRGHGRHRALHRQAARPDLRRLPRRAGGTGAGARSWPWAIRSSTTSRVPTISASPAASSPAASTPASFRRAPHAPTTSGNSRS